MPILIDGNNLMHGLPPADRNREGVRRLTLERTRHERMRVYLIFDGPPPSEDRTREELGQLTILYSGSRSADDIIVSRLPKGSAAANWTVITNDRGLIRRVRSAGARVRKLSDWPKTRAPKRRSKALPEAKLSNHEIKEWESYFASGGDEDQ